MAETTPGPLIMVTQFVGFMGAARNSGSMEPMIAGSLAALLTAWMTFLPSFLWIFLGAPFAERIQGNVALGSAMTAITAAVVGVVLNLAVWFAMHTIFAEVVELSAAPSRFDVPVVESLRVAPFLLALVAMVAMFRFRAGPLSVISGCGIAGMMLGFIAF